ncbi:hypothetical protein D9M68_419830 [compost metagenome]
MPVRTGFEVLIVEVVRAAARRIELIRRATCQQLHTQRGVVGHVRGAGNLANVQPRRRGLVKVVAIHRHYGIFGFRLGDFEGEKSGQRDPDGLSQTILTKACKEQRGLFGSFHGDLQISLLAGNQSLRCDCPNL